MKILNLEPFVQFKKREQHPWRSVTFSKVVGFLKDAIAYISYLISQ